MKQPLRPRRQFPQRFSCHQLTCSEARLPGGSPSVLAAAQGAHLTALEMLLTERVQRLLHSSIMTSLIRSNLGGWPVRGVTSGSGTTVPLAGVESATRSQTPSVDAVLGRLAGLGSRLAAEAGLSEEGAELLLFNDATGNVQFATSWPWGGPCLSSPDGALSPPPPQPETRTIPRMRTTARRPITSVILPSRRTRNNPNRTFRDTGGVNLPPPPRSTANQRHSRHDDAVCYHGCGAGGRQDSPLLTNKTPDNKTTRLPRPRKREFPAPLTQPLSPGQTAAPGRAAGAPVAEPY